MKKVLNVVLFLLFLANIGFSQGYMTKNPQLSVNVATNVPTPGKVLGTADGVNNYWTTITASNVTFTNEIMGTISNIQEAIVQLNQGKFDKTGGNIYGQISIGPTNVKNEFQLEIYGTNTTDGTLNPQINGIRIDGSTNVDKALVFADGGSNKWAWQTYRDEDGEFLYLYGYEAQREPFVVNKGGRIGFNKQSNIMNYHARWMGTEATYRDDLELGGTWTKPFNMLYKIWINSTGTVDTFVWNRSFDNGVTWNGTGVTTNNCSNTPVDIEYGITATFDYTNSHAINDEWQFTAFAQVPQASVSVGPAMFDEILNSTNLNQASTNWIDISYDMANLDAGTHTMLRFTNSVTYIGRKVQYNSFYIGLQTPSAGLTLKVEYWNGSEWTELSHALHNLVDNTGNLTQSGNVFYDKKLLTGWSKTIPPGKGSGYNLYWLRISTTTTPSIAPVVVIITPHGDKRLAVYSAHLDSTPSFYVDNAGGTYAKNAYRSSTNNTFGNAELITESRMQTVISRLRDYVWYCTSNTFTEAPISRRCSLVNPSTSFATTNALSAGANAINIYSSTNQIGTTNIAAGSKFNFKCFANANNTQPAYVYWQLCEINSQRTNILATSVSNIVATTVGSFGQDIVLSSNVTVNSTNYLAARVMGFRGNNAVNLIIYFGGAYASALSLPTIATTVVGDNLGNHTATTNINMAGFSITNMGNIGPCVTPTILVSSPTTTITRANGMYMALDCTNNVILSFNSNDVPNSVMYSFRLDVRMNANSLTWDTNYFMSTNLTSMATNVYVPVIGIRPYGGGLIEVR